MTNPIQPPTETALAAACHNALQAAHDIISSDHRQTGNIELLEHYIALILTDRANLSAALARVEGERDAWKREAFDTLGKAKTEIDTLRADLAAKGEHERKLHAEIIELADATLTHLNPECEAAVHIRRAQSLLELSALAARAAGKGEKSK